ncbi:phosphohydrolase [Streptomyces lichenis]|uniref:Phosphohydrolase n=1 Tax=Streptomyces lichenis TaxID=2306967 RepID=A0ABT0I9E2_9ACTN|nr:phosphohydrolase [Streptomyces lichenis]MCK8677938.1 phosphohydrolase [Streptomyces lichenis]
MAWADRALGREPDLGDHVGHWATHITRAELSSTLPRRWAPTQGVAHRTAEVSQVLNQDGSPLVAAATLHDIGYAPRLAVTGFHPLDGARFLRDEHRADQRLVRLVANQSFALLEAEECGLQEELATEFPVLNDPLLVDSLVYCDMTTTPDGDRTTAQDRVAEISSRYGDNSVVGRFIRRAAPEIFASVERVEAALAAQPRQG